MLCSSQIHETIEYINQLKTERDFMLSFSDNPQEFIQDWLKSQSRDLKVNRATHHFTLLLAHHSSRLQLQRATDRTEVTLSSTRLNLKNGKFPVLCCKTLFRIVSYKGSMRKKLA